MAMHHRLPGSRTDIEPDVVPGWLEIFLNQFLALIGQGKHSMFLFNRQGKIISHMPERDHKQVPLADRVAVPAGIAEIVLRHVSSATGLQNGQIMRGSMLRTPGLQ